MEDPVCAGAAIRGRLPPPLDKKVLDGCVAVFLTMTFICHFLPPTAYCELESFVFF